jgi:hypothetical protein
LATLTYTTLGGIVAGAPNTASDVTTAFTQAQTSINNVEDTQYTNQNNSVWKTYGAISGTIYGNYAAATYWFSLSGSPIASASSDGNGAHGFMPQAADLAVSGKTTTFRVNAVVATNASGPATTLTFGVHPVTAQAAGGGVISYTLGAAVAGSTAAFASPSASGCTQSSSTGFTIAALGSSTQYMFGVVLAGTTNASSCTQATLSLQVRHV